jgi:hypothetical protein
LKIETAPTLRDGGLHLVRVCERCEQRLRLRDLGHFRRRRKAVERFAESSAQAQKLRYCREDAARLCPGMRPGGGKPSMN